FPYSRDRVFFLDLAKRAVEFAPGVSVPAKPFWGVIGVAPPRSMGRVPSGPPNVNGGNMDNHDLQPGTSLFLPVHVPGALLAVSDGHSAQGNGEVGMSAENLPQGRNPGGAPQGHAHRLAARRDPHPL